MVSSGFSETHTADSSGLNQLSDKLEEPLAAFYYAQEARPV